MDWAEEIEFFNSGQRRLKFKETSIFIYLEIMQMVSIFFKTGRIPVRYPLYISMIGLARYISLENLDGREAIFITGSIFLISLALVGLAYRTKIVRSTPKQEDEE